MFFELFFPPVNYHICARSLLLAILVVPMALLPLMSCRRSTVRQSHALLLRKLAVNAAGCICSADSTRAPCLRACITSLPASLYMYFCSSSCRPPLCHSAGLCQPVSHRKAFVTAPTSSHISRKVVKGVCIFYIPRGEDSRVNCYVVNGLINKYFVSI